MVNWLDIVLLILIGLAAAKGYKRGAIIEICSLAALFLGVYAAVHFSGMISTALGLGEERTITSFLITFLIVLLAVHLLARALTALIDIAMLGWANRIAGIGVAAVRSAFMLSILVNLLASYTDGRIPPENARNGSALYAPIAAFAPVVLPPLAESKWVKDLIERTKAEAAGWTDRSE